MAGRSETANLDAPFAQAVRDLFGEDYTHQALAERLGIRTATEISHIANGVRDPSDRILTAFRETFPEHWPVLFVKAVEQKLQSGERPVVPLPLSLNPRRLRLALLLSWTFATMPDEVATRTTAFLLKEMRATGWEIPK